MLQGDSINQQKIVPYYAKLASPTTLKKLKTFDKVYVVGFPHNLELQTTSEGILYMEEEGFLGSSAPIAPGNSGRSIISC
jgi:hypothetical protein